MFSPYSGTSSLAKVKKRIDTHKSHSIIDPILLLLFPTRVYLLYSWLSILNRSSVQILRFAAFGTGVVYGSFKLGYLKVGGYYSIQRLFMQVTCKCLFPFMRAECCVGKRQKSGERDALIWSLWFDGTEEPCEREESFLSSLSLFCCLWSVSFSPPPSSKLKSVNWAESMHIDIKQSEICGLHYLTRFFFKKAKTQKASQIYKKKERETSTKWIVNHFAVFG